MRASNPAMKRWVALAGAAAVLILGFGSLAEHFDGRAFRHPGQLIPVFFSALGATFLFTLGVLRLARRWVEAGLQMVGVAAMGIGVAGLTFHLVPFMRAAATVSSMSLGQLLAVMPGTPSLLGPVGFVGLGLVLAMVGSARVRLELTAGQRVVVARRLPSGLEVLRFVDPKKA